ncbi:UNVERIFIED_CONTAM: hypothetical protein H355_010677 [Colinus virginianus]|nr:hypothetical protein H355_010677 [Colinus virginianus]
MGAGEAVAAGLKMSEAEKERVDGSVSLVRAALAEAVAADWVLEFSCYCLCRHFVEERGAEFRRWRDVAQAISNGFSKVTASQKKMVYLCQLLIRIVEGKRLAVFFTGLVQKRNAEQTVFRVVAVYMEKGYYKEAAEVLERLFTDSESHKSLRMKLATVVKNKDPYVPLLQSFSFNLLLSKVKSYIDLFLKENATNFLLQAATKQLESKGGEVTGWQNKTVNVKEERENDLEAEQRFVFSNVLLRDMLGCILKQYTVSHKTARILNCYFTAGSLLVWMYIHCFLGLEEWQTMKERGGHSCGRKRQPWTYDEDMKLKSGVREFGVGNWTKILIHGDFNNRTSVMLKDRWRTLCKIK